MRGLMVKDFRLFMNQSKFFLGILVIAVLLAITGTEPFFIIGYGTLMCTMFTLSTANYDEFNNGNAFLFTMPFVRKNYVIEKYVFGMLIGGGVWVALTIIGSIITMSKEPQANMLQWVAVAGVFLIAVPLVLSFMIPVELKFGSEKSRIALIAITFIFAGTAGWLIEHTDIPMETILRKVSEMNILFLVGAVVVFTVVMTALSICISIRILEKKQF